MKKALLKKSDLVYFYDTNDTIKSKEDFKKILNESIDKISDTVKLEVLRFLSFLDHPSQEGIEIKCGDLQAIIDVQNDVKVKHALINGQSGYRGIKKGPPKRTGFLGK